jgi:hypothetical protein
MLTPENSGGFEGSPYFGDWTLHLLKAETLGHPGLSAIVVNAILRNPPLDHDVTENTTQAMALLKLVRDNAYPSCKMDVLDVGQWNGIWRATLYEKDWSILVMGAGLTPALAICDCAVRAHVKWIRLTQP